MSPRDIAALEDACLRYVTAYACNAAAVAKAMPAPYSYARVRRALLALVAAGKLTKTGAVYSAKKRKGAQEAPKP